jgi:hypothetical protein
MGISSAVRVRREANGTAAGRDTPVEVTHRGGHDAAESSSHRADACAVDPFADAARLRKRIEGGSAGTPTHVIGGKVHPRKRRQLRVVPWLELGHGSPTVLHAALEASGSEGIVGQLRMSQAYDRFILAAFDCTEQAMLLLLHSAPIAEERMGHGQIDVIRRRQLRSIQALEPCSMRQEGRLHLGDPAQEEQTTGPPHGQCHQRPIAAVGRQGSALKLCFFQRAERLLEAVVELGPIGEPSQVPNTRTRLAGARKVVADGASDLVESLRAHGLQRPRDGCVKQPATRHQQTLVDDLSNSIMGEIQSLVRALQQAHSDELFDRAGQSAPAPHTRSREQGKIEIPADDGGRRQDILTGVRDTSDAAQDQLSDP